MEFYYPEFLDNHLENLQKKVEFNIKDQIKMIKIEKLF
jgi:hypothetical protein